MAIVVKALRPSREVPPHRVGNIDNNVTIKNYISKSVISYNRILSVLVFMNRLNSPK